LQHTSDAEGERAMPDIAAARWRDALRTWLAILAGLVVAAATFGIHQLLLSLDEQRLTERFDRLSAQRAKVLDDHVHENIEALALLADFHYASQHIDRDEFKQFAEGIRARRSAVTGLSMALHVAGDGRAEFEKLLLEHARDSDGIQALMPGRGWITAPVADEHFPILYSEPPVTSDTVAGMDLWTEPMRREAIAAACESGGTRMTPRITPLQLPVDKPVDVYVALFQAVYRGGKPDGATTPRRDDVVALFGLLMNVDELLNTAAEVFGTIGLDCAVYTASPGSPRTPLAVRLSHSRPLEEQQADDVALLEDSPLQRETIVDVAGQQWVFRFAAAPAYLAHRDRVAATTVLTAGLLLSGIIVAYLMMLGSRVRSTGIVVAQRTRELHLRTAELEAEVDRRRAAEQEVRSLNAGLEQRVRERTAQLESANKELEAFSYTVSHDLRAPLRAMDGFSSILIEDCAAGLDANGKRYLDLVRQNAVKMGRLIDDLLAFARLGRQSMRHEHVEPKEIVRSILEDMRRLEPQRDLKVVIGDLPAMWGDPRLLRQVYVNLLSNAAKFTRTRPQCRIEVGSTRRDGQVVYHVLDNGVGFDAKYANKLFGVFQRLHRAEDFEGTGVGLAIVQRVVQRHGGRVWAESMLDQWARISFSLAPEAPESPS
jgi:signal transduction histidine kinase